MEKKGVSTAVELSIIAGVLLISFSFLYHFVILPHQKWKAKQLGQISTKYLLDACLTDAYLSYRADWAKDCKRIGLDHKGEDCRLPSWNTEIHQKRYKENRDECYKKYTTK